MTEKELKIKLVGEYFSLLGEKMEGKNDEWLSDKFDYMYDLPLFTLKNYVNTLKKTKLIGEKNE